LFENGQSAVKTLALRHWRHFKKQFFENVLATVGDVDKVAIQAVVANIGTVEVFAKLGLVL